MRALSNLKGPILLKDWFVGVYSDFRFAQQFHSVTLILPNSISTIELLLGWQKRLTLFSGARHIRSSLGNVSRQNRDVDIDEGLNRGVQSIHPSLLMSLAVSRRTGLYC